MVASLGARRLPLAAVAVVLSLDLAPARGLAGAPQPEAGAEPEPPIALSGAEGDYLRALHERIHQRWAAGFVASVAQTLPAANALNDPSLQAVVLFSIRWDGTVVEATLVSASGADAFDRAAVDAVRKESPFRVPPVEALSDDGLAYFRWTLARDHRLCAGGELSRHEAPLGESLPRLLVESRVREALLRVGREMKSSRGDDAVTRFAKAWLARPFTDPVADAAAAEALAGTGDFGQVDRLRVALGNRETVGRASAALGHFKVDVCALVLDRLMDVDLAARERGALALQAAGESEPQSSRCIGPLSAMVLDTQLPGRLRLIAAEALLVAASPERARPVFSEAARDGDLTLRARAVLLGARPGGNRAALYRLLPLVHDPAVEIRSAAAAALVRCCGDLALTELVLVFKESDTRPALAVAAELGRQSSEASAAFLGRMARRHEPEVRHAVIEALALRRDPPARALLAKLGGAAATDVLAAKPADADSATSAYQALLRASRYPEAAEWIVAQLDQLEPRAQVEVLGAWLTRPEAPLPSRPVSAR